MKQTILVVDDAASNIDILVSVLGEDYDVCVALDGETALEDILKHKPDLVLLDIMMPGIDGYEVCQRLKADKLTKDIPIIFITARNQAEDVTTGFKLGAADFITKPLNADVVKVRVKNQLSLVKTKRQLEELSTKLSHYISPQIYRSIFDGKRDVRIEAQRKKLTVFFSDIVDFTPRTESMEPEDLTYMLNSYLNAMSDIVLKYGGTLDKFIGDALLVFFGDPESNGVEEDAIACVTMALEMRSAIHDLQNQWSRTSLTLPFQVRMGISAGYCTVGNFGSDKRMDYTIIGNQVNLASRLQSAADPDEILISQETWSLVKASIHCVRKEPMQVKGFRRPIPIYQAIGFYDQLGQESRIINTCQGFSIFLDPDVIAEPDREMIIDTLQNGLHCMQASQNVKGSSSD